MKANPFLKLIEKDKKLALQEARGEAIRGPFNVMMKRKQERYSVLLGMKSEPKEKGLDSEQVKKELKALKKFIEVNNEPLSAWDLSIEYRRKFYQQWSLDNVLEIKDNEKRRGFLNSFPEMKQTLQEILLTMENLIVFQEVVLGRMEASVIADEENIYDDPRLLNLN